MKLQMNKLPKYNIKIQGIPSDGYKETNSKDHISLKSELEQEKQEFYNAC